MAKLFQTSARPVRADVDKLVDVLDLKLGDLISHDQIAKIIDEPHGTNRYAAVVQSWKRRMWREHKLQIEADVGTGYRILTADQSVSSAANGMKRVTRANRRLGSRARAIDTRNMAPDRQQLVGIVAKYSDAVADAYRQARKAIATPSAVTVLPLRLAKTGK